MICIGTTKCTSEKGLFPYNTIRKISYFAGSNACQGMLIRYQAHGPTNHNVTNLKGCTTRAWRRPIKARQRGPLKVVISNVSQGIDPGIISSSPFYFKMIISTILIPLFASAVFCSDVIELGDSNFNDGVKGEEIMLVEFFAPWYVETQSCFRLVSLNSN